MLKRFALALVLGAATLALLPSAAFAVYHQETAPHSYTWQNPNGAANITCYIRMTYDVSDSHPGVYRITQLAIRQTKNAGNVYVIGHIRGYICAHDYDTSNGSHGIPTYEHNWPGLVGGNATFVTVPMQRSMTSGFLYTFSQSAGDWGSDFSAWHFVDGCNWMGVAERALLQAKFDIRASSDGTLLKTVTIDVNPAW